MLGIIWGLISLLVTYQETILKELEIPSYYIGFIGSVLLKNMSVQSASIIAGIMFTVVIIFMYFYMKKRLGLKPEEYKKEDVDFTMMLQDI